MKFLKLNNRASTWLMAVFLLLITSCASNQHVVSNKRIQKRKLNTGFFVNLNKSNPKLNKKEINEKEYNFEVNENEIKKTEEVVTEGQLKEITNEITTDKEVNEKIQAISKKEKSVNHKKDRIESLIMKSKPEIALVKRQNKKAQKREVDPNLGKKGITIMIVGLSGIILAILLALVLPSSGIITTNIILAVLASAFWFLFLIGAFMWFIHWVRGRRTR